MSTIESLYEADLVDKQMIGLREVQGRLSVADEETSKHALKQDKNCLFIRDTVKHLSGWACFNRKPDFGYKVGQNEPCPCGSGKKYKKCCGF